MRVPVRRARSARKRRAKIPYRRTVVAVLSLVLAGALYLVSVRGEALKPIYRSAPQAARNDPKLYQCLGLLDAIRAGRARERKLAEKHLHKLIASPPRP